MPDLDAWLESSLGRDLLAREQDYFDRAVADIFGFNAVQLGFAGCDLLRANRMPMRFRVGASGAVRVRGALFQLPLASQSIDLVVLPHALEFADNPHQILREVERVLMPEGRLIVSGFNPFSLWGIPHVLPHYREDFPWRGHFISLPRIKDWLALLGLEVTAGRMCCYAPPFRQENWRRRFAFMEAAGDRWWALAGGVYFLQARKRVQGMRLIMPKWGELSPKKALTPVAQKQVTENRQWKI